MIVAVWLMLDFKKGPARDQLLEAQALSIHSMDRESNGSLTSPGSASGSGSRPGTLPYSGAVDNRPRSMIIE
jgi:hypothetical protein